MVGVSSYLFVEGEGSIYFLVLKLWIIYIQEEREGRMNKDKRVINKYFLFFIRCFMK